MRSRRTTMLSLPLIALAMAAGAPSVADASWRDRAYADSFGNLVIVSPGGYKRIIVGQGSQAERVADYADAGEPDAFILNESDGRRSDRRDDRRWRDTRFGCYQPPFLLKGRSYMYGFDEGELPPPFGGCR